MSANLKHRKNRRHVALFVMVIVVLTGTVYAAPRVGPITPENSIIGAYANDQIGSHGIHELPSGNIVIVSPNWNGSRGAVTCLTPSEYRNGNIVISEANSLVGSTPNDRVGLGGIDILTNGHFVVNSYFWISKSNGAFAGAVTWVNGTTCLPYGESSPGVVVSATNSLVGVNADLIGNDGIIALTNGNYVVASRYFDYGAGGDVGSVTWGNGNGGTVGPVGPDNSLIGSITLDQVGSGEMITWSGGIIALPNGHYVVVSPALDNETSVNAGAVTWGNGNGGTVGHVNPTNSLVGEASSRSVGRNGVKVLDNGHYIVRSSGATTWGNKDGGLTGLVSATNSLLFSGNINTVTALTNGHYVVRTSGGVTWGDGNTGTVGTVSAANSLVNGKTTDALGSCGVTPLTNGHYAVCSNQWGSGSATGAGAITWGNGNGGTVGTVSVANSLVGTTNGNSVGLGGVTALTNGNYVVRSGSWDNGTISNVGAVTWGNGSGGTVGVVSEANSLIGTTGGDQLGYDGITVLANGNYVVASRDWDNGSIIDPGAVTWVNGNTGIAGHISAANSLIGTAPNDRIGQAGITALSDGNYIVNSYLWDNGAATDVGAILWADGSTGIVGQINSTSALVGSTPGDQIGSGGITVLPNGNYVVRSPLWDNGAATNAGAATWVNGTGSTTGSVNASNSIVGTKSEDRVGINATALANGNYVVRSHLWDNDTLANAGALTWGNGLTPTAAEISSANSLVGSTSAEQLGLDEIIPLSDGSYIVRLTTWDNGGLSNIGAITWSEGAEPGLMVSKTSTEVSEGGATDAYTFVLFTQPSSPVIISFSVDVADEIALDVPSLTFDPSNWFLPQTVTITAVDDDIMESTETVTISHTVSSPDVNYNGLVVDEVVVTMTSEDSAGVVVSKENAAVTEGGATDNYTVVLESEPTADVTVGLTFTDTDLQVQKNTGGFQGSPLSLTFTSENWDTAQTIEVQAIDDDEMEGDELVVITHTVTSEDANYNGITPTPNDEVSVTITDDENTPPVLAEIGSRSGYANTTLTFDVDATDVNIPAQTLTFSLEAGAPLGATIDPATGLFTWTLDGSVTPGAYPVTITVTDDGLPALSDSETITLSVGEINHLSNYGFETAGSSEKIAKGWAVKGTTKQDRRICNTDVKSYAREGQCAYRFTSSKVITTPRYIQRGVNITTFAKGDTLELRGWVKANTLTAGGRLILIAKYANGTSETKKVNLKPGTYGYQQVSKQLTLARKVVKVIARVQGGRAKGIFYADELAVVEILSPAMPLPDLRLSN